MTTVANPYNTNPSTVDSILRQRQTQADLAHEQGLVQPQATAPENPSFFGVEQTPNDSSKGIGRKVLEDAALLSYAIPVGLARTATGLFTDPIKTVTDAGSGVVQSVKDVVDPEYYKAHPLLGVVNALGFVQPIAGVLKSAGLKVAMTAALETGVREAVNLGVEETVARTALTAGMKNVGGALLKRGAFGNAVWEAAKDGNVARVGEIVRNMFVKNGVAEDVALRVSTSVSDNLYTTFSRQTTKMKVLDAIIHPVKAGFDYAGQATDPIRTMVFGKPAETAVAKLYGADTVAKNPQGFWAIEEWASRVAKEQGLADTIENRARIQQSWVEKDSTYASLTPEQRVTHFQEYAATDMKRAEIQKMTGKDIVLTKTLSPETIDSMIATIQDAPVLAKADVPSYVGEAGVGRADVEALVKTLEDIHGSDITKNIGEIQNALVKNPTREGLIAVIQKLGQRTSLVNFSKFSSAAQKLADELAGSGYRVGYAPKSKPISQAADIFAGAGAKAAGGKVITQEAGAIAADAVVSKRTAFGKWLERVGLSPGGVVDSDHGFSYRENFTQGILGDFADKYGGVVKARSIKGAGKASIPIEKLYSWLDKNKTLIQSLRGKYTLPIRTVFDLKEADFINIGFSKEMAADLVGVSKKALNDIPASIVGLGDKVTNFLRTRNGKYDAWMSNWYETYQRIAYKGRYDLSPFFSAQEFAETGINTSLFLKDPALLPGANQIAKIGSWTADKLSGYLTKNTATYLKKIVAEPSIQEVSIVKDEIFGTLPKTMTSYSNPDTLGVQNAIGELGKGVAGEAAFRESIQSKNFFFAKTGYSPLWKGTSFNKALAEKFGMSLEEATSFTVENGNKVYRNPQMLQMMRESTQSLFHYQSGFQSSPLIKTLNLVWFPFRFEAKTVSLASRWLGTLSAPSRFTVMNNWVNFANWAGTDEGIKWRRTNRNLLYNIIAYTTAYEQMGQAVEAVAKGRLFGGNTGLIGGVPFGFVVNLARQLALLPEDTDQFDPKTGRQFKKEIPKKIVSAAAFSTAVEQFLISMSPGTPFYSLTSGVVSGVSPAHIWQSLSRQIIGGARNALEGKDVTKGGQTLQKDFKKVPLDYSRLAQ